MTWPHRLMEAPWALRKTVGYSIASGVVAALFIVLVLGIRGLLEHYVPVGSFAAALPAALALTIFFQPLQADIQRWVDRRFFRVQVERAEILHSLSSSILTQVDKEALVSSILDQLDAAIHPKMATIFLRETDASKEPPFETYVAKRFVGNGPENMRLSCPASLVRAISHRPAPIDLARPSLEAELAFPDTLRAQLLSLGASVVAPFARPEKLIGFLVLGEKRSELPYSREDFNLLEILGNNAAIAFDNADLYTKLKIEVDTLQSAFAGASDGLLLTDDSLGILSANAMALRILRAKPEILWTSFAMATEAFEPRCPLAPSPSPPPHPVGGRNSYKNSSPPSGGEGQGEGVTTYEMTRRVGDPRRGTEREVVLWVQATRITSNEGDPDGFVILLRDVTEERKEEKNQRDFLRMTGEKLDAPLQGLYGVQPLLEKDLPLLTGAPSQAVVQALAHQIFRLRQLWESIYRFIQIETASRMATVAPLSVRAVVDRAMSQFAPGPEIVVDGSLWALPPVLGDPERLEIAFQELIENAVKFNRSSKPKILIRAWVGAENRAAIAIEDNGPGIPPEERERIFRPFYQIDESFTGNIPGAGLGLTLVRKIIESQGGSIAVDETPAPGTRFILTMPKAAMAQAA